MFMVFCEFIQSLFPVVTILALFKERKRRIPINKGFQLLAHLKTPQFSCSIAEVGLEM